MPCQVPECLLIADDLTGACDAAAPFAVMGRRASVLLSAEADSAGAEVIAISTESRGLEPAGIRSAMERAAASLPCPAAPLLFLKIDSTLRGHPELEIAAALEIFGRRAAVVCPAFPAMRRTVRAGCLEIAGAADFTPMPLAQRLTSAHVAAGEIAAALSRGLPVISLDAICDADLDHIAAEIRSLAAPILWAGSAGLASALARALEPRPPLSPPFPASGPALFCIGSNHPATLEQQDALLSERRALALPCHTSAEQISAALAGGHHVLVRIPRDRPPVEALVSRLRAASIPALVLSGGDTAALVCAAMHVDSIDLCGQILPGIARGILRGGPFDGLAVATKSGGFGDRNAMIQIADDFTCPNPPNLSPPLS